MMWKERLSDRVWKIGDLNLKETNEYKYLGIYFTRTLKSHYHISSYIKDKAETKINGMIRILSNHADFNRIQFGTSIWNSVILPSVARACAVWFHTSEADLKILESIQYQAAKAVIKTKSNPARCALLRELGWEPINDFLDRQRITYYARFNYLPESRLCKMVYHEMRDNLNSENNHPWKYVQYLNSVLSKYGIDDSNGHIDNLKTIMRQRSNEILINEFRTKSSLNLYNDCFIKQGSQKYLEDKDFNRARLKLQARVNILPLKDMLYRINISNDNKCELCAGNNVDNLEHFLLNCSFFEHERDFHLRELQNRLISSGGRSVFDLYVDLPTREKLILLIGDTGSLIDNEVYALFDKIGKDMLCQFWSKRHDSLTAYTSTTV